MPEQGPPYVARGARDARNRPGPLIARQPLGRLTARCSSNDIPTIPAGHQVAEQGQPQGGGGILDALGGIFGGGQKQPQAPTRGGRAPARQPDNLAVKVGKQVAGNLAAQVGRDVGAKVIGAMIGGAMVARIVMKSMKRW